MKNIGNKALFLKLLTPLLSLCVFFSQAWAQSATEAQLVIPTSATSLSTLQTLPVPAVGSDPFHLSFKTGYSQLLQQRPDNSTDACYEFWLKAQYQLSENYTLVGQIYGWTDASSEQQGSDFDSGKLSLDHKASDFGANDFWHFGQGLTLQFPVSHEERDHQSMLVGAEPYVTLDTSPWHFTKSVSLVSGLYFSLFRNFNTYTQNINGTSNLEYGAIQGLRESLDLGQHFRLEAGVSHYSTWDYDNTSGDFLTHYEEVRYRFTKSFSVAMGLLYGNPYVAAYGPDGRSVQYSVASEKYTYGYTNMTLKF